MEPSDTESVNDTKTSSKSKKRRTKSKRTAAHKPSLGFQPERILGASEIDGVVIFRIKEKNSNEWHIVKAHKVYDACPELAIEFYEAHLIFDGEPLSKYQ